MKKERKELTDRVAPLVLGLYSVQAIAYDPADPDITVYRMRAKQAIAWLRRMAKRGKFKYFAVRHAKDAWDIYDSDGRLYALCEDIEAKTNERLLGDSIEPDNARITYETRKMVGDTGASCVASVAGCPSVSSIKRSNFSIAVYTLLADASEDDLRAIYIVDSRCWSCRVMGVVANVSLLSQDAQDAYLDMVPSLVSTLPMVDEHYKLTLIRQLARERADYISTIIEDCAKASGATDEIQATMAMAWLMASVAKKEKFIEHMLALVGDLDTTDTGVEIVGLSSISEHGRDIIDGHHILY